MRPLFGQGRALVAVGLRFDMEKTCWGFGVHKPVAHVTASPGDGALSIAALQALFHELSVMRLEGLGLGFSPNQQRHTWTCDLSPCPAYHVACNCKLSSYGPYQLKKPRSTEEATCH